jgi:hypothetical protein
MHNMLYYKNIFSKINNNFVEVNQKQFDFYLKDYLLFLENVEYVDKIDALANSIEKHNELLKPHFFEFFNFLDNRKKASIFSLFLFKSINRITLLETVNKISYLSMDAIINDVIEIYVNLSVFYVKSELTDEHSQSFKGYLVKLLNFLILEETIILKRTFIKNYTTDELSFGFENIELPDFSYLKISKTPFRLISVSSKENFTIYNVGGFFTFVKKVFLENVRSDYYFKLNDFSYIEKMSNNKIYLNLDDLSSIILFFEDREYSIESIKKNVSNFNRVIAENLKIILNHKKKIKKRYIESTKIFIKEKFDSNDINSITEVKKFCIDVFYTYCENYIKNKIKSDIEIISKFDFLSIVYQHFISIFENTELFLKFENIEEFFM